MTSDKLDTRLTYQKSILSMFEWMATCAMIIDPHGIILDVNQQALEFFRTSTKEDFIFDKQQIKNLAIDARQTTDLIEKIKANKDLINRKTLLRRFDKSIACVDMSVCLFPDDSKNLLIQFTETPSQSYTILTELSQAYKHEVLKLKPYLNKAGKDLLDQLIVSDILEGVLNNKPKREKQIEIIRDEKIKKLAEMHPILTEGDLRFCGYLALNMTIDEIANVTGKTTNSLRVVLHRIIVKINLSKTQELRKLLNSIEV